MVHNATVFASNFSARFPRNRAELKQCFLLLTKSPHYDRTLKEKAVVDAWETLLKTAIGDILILENPAYNAFISDYNIRNGVDLPLWIGCLFGSFVKEKYVKDVIAGAAILNIGIDFLQKYIATVPGEQENPAPTSEEITAGHAKPPDQGLHFLEYMSIIHPVIKPSREMDHEWTKLATCIRELTASGYAGFNLHSWLNFVVGKYTASLFEKSGHKIVWEQVSNPRREDNDKRYLVCVTRDSQVSQRLNLEEGKFEVDTSTWDADLFVSQPSRANLNDNQKRVAYLLAREYSRAEIAKYLFPDEWEGIHRTQLLGRVGRYQTAVYNAMVRGKHVLDSSSQESLIRLLRRNLQEVRPLLIPLYPDPRILEVQKPKGRPRKEE